MLLKLRSAAQPCDDWVLNSHIKMNSAIFTQFSFRKIAAIIRENYAYKSLFVFVFINKSNK